MNINIKYTFKTYIHIISVRKEAIPITLPKKKLNALQYVYTPVYCPEFHVLKYSNETQYLAVKK